MTHYLDKCKHGVVVRQCRCPGPKTVNVVPCPPMCPSEPTYLCDQCGKPRTKAEGGTVQPGTGSNLPWVGGYVSLSHVREDEDLAEENAKLRERIASLEAEVKYQKGRADSHARRFTQTEIENAKMRTALERIGIQADHQNPFYAFGDNEAACDMSARLDNIHNLASEFVHQI